MIQRQLRGNAHAHNVGHVFRAGPASPFLMAAALYLVCTFLLIYLFSRAERRWLAFIKRP